MSAPTTTQPVGDVFEGRTLPGPNAPTLNHFTPVPLDGRNLRPALLSVTGDRYHVGFPLSRPSTGEAPVGAPVALRYGYTATSGTVFAILGSSTLTQAALLNPPLVDGHRYYFWGEDWNQAVLMRWESDGQRFRDQRSVTRDMRTLPALSWWVEADVPSDPWQESAPSPAVATEEVAAPQLSEATSQVDALQAAIRDLDTTWADLNGSLNSLASDRGWCGDYDEIITALGFDGRDDEDPPERDYTVSLQVQVNSSLSLSPRESSTMQAALSEVNGFAGIIELHSAEVTWTVAVTGGFTATSEDEVYQNVDTDWVDGVLEAEGINYDSVEDWSITGVSED